jgi:large subunit ribosomal protein L15
MKLHDLRAPKGARKDRRRIGRGAGSGRGTTAGKGQKGQQARSGPNTPAWFEGGQFPLAKRLPYRRGFNNPSRVEYQPVNLDKLAEFPAGTTVGPRELIQAGLLDDDELVKVLAHGELPHALNVRAHKFSKTAREKIEAAGGSVEEIPHGYAERTA